MCGIFALIEETNINPENESDVWNNYKDVIDNVLKKLNHRGPDSTGNKLIIDSNKTVLMLHTRLKITGNDSVQPIVNRDNTVYLVINGEIFNWKNLEQELNYKCTQSDCEIIIPLYEKYKNNIPLLLSKLKGQFSFFLYDLRNKHVLIARDPIGVTPLYVGYHPTLQRFVVSSELKCLTMEDKTVCEEINNQKDFDVPCCNKNIHNIERSSFVDNIKLFYPRKYIYTSINDKSINNLMEYSKEYMDFYNNYNVLADLSYNLDTDILNVRNEITAVIRDKLTNSVKSQLQDLINSDSPEFGVLLSGGLDSSLITSLVVSLAKSMGYNKKIKTFSIGVNESVPDLIAAREVSKFLDTDHHEFYFTIEEGLKAIPSVIWFAESYDCTTIRASTPMYLLTKSIKQKFPDIKVLFSGELSDELLCYLYGANAPSELDFQIETINLVSNVHLFDCLRSNKMCMANSIEVRVPFTDIDFVNYILKLHPKWKIFGKENEIDKILDRKKMEKHILRDAFIGYLPDNILYRKKEQFSDGVSGFNKEKDNWIDAITVFCDKKYNLYDYERFRNKYTYNKPDTKEKLYYRNIFCQFFNSTSYKNTSEFTVKMWEPKWSNTTDPSGRSQTFWEKN
jgi:asparagine synthase (glutamine-hydrolysing)|uniref:asparagine synthase (glutamine-hydrolyzing) n=1 Tax=viral metagenome TaxID=1070528 RepID=A0A6C0ALN6_9ZZZZ